MSRANDWRTILADERMLDRSQARHDRSLWSAEATGGMVATAHYAATRAGAEILDAGGNAIDAAVAASFALAVCEPAGSGLGGMAMMQIHDARRGATVFLNGACRAPAAATPEAVSGSKRYTGYRAIAVPTHVAVMCRALADHGTFDRRAVLEPAIRMAEQGVLWSPTQATLSRRYRKSLKRNTGGTLFLDEGGEPMPVGFRLRQPALANTLGRLRDAGLEDFYVGEIARSIAADMERNGAFLSGRDLEDVPWPEIVRPLSASWRGMRVKTAPPPADGTTLIQLLRAHEALPAELRDLRRARGVVAAALLIRAARSERRREFLERKAGREFDRLGEQSLRRLIESASALGETSHVSVMDRWGNAVALTQSLERSFGSKVVTPGLGFLYNGYMKGFKIRATRHPHYLRPGARARSNAAPTLLFEIDGDGRERPAIAIGSTGSERMISGIFLVLARLSDSDPFEAVRAPRLHCTPEGEVLAEFDGLPEGTLELLARHGLTATDLGRDSFQVGGLQLVSRRGDRFVGVAEPRRDGAAAGPD